jgi:hypothetical protein
MARVLLRRIVHKRCYVLPKLVERLTLDVHHMTGVEVAGSYVTAQADVESKMLERVIDSREGCSKVKVALSHKHLHIGVLDERATQIGAEVGKALLRRPPVPLGEASAQDLIDLIGLVVQLGANVLVEH